jgi:hypothetical protein
VALAAIAVLEIGQLLPDRISVPAVLNRVPLAARWGLYAGFVMCVIMFGVYKNTQFIYFQF